MSCWPLPTLICIKKFGQGDNNLHSEGTNGVVVSPPTRRGARLCSRTQCACFQVRIQLRVSLSMFRNDVYGLMRNLSQTARIQKIKAALFFYFEAFTLVQSL
jgi:hypothetical protein